MIIQLKPEQEQFIKEKIANGEYNNPDEVISDALNLLSAKIDKIQECEYSNGLRTQLSNIERNNFLEKANEAYLALRNNPSAWQEELAERKLWEQTIADGVTES